MKRLRRNKPEASNRRCNSVALFLAGLIVLSGLLQGAPGAAAQEAKQQKAASGSISGHITIQGKLAPDIEVALLPERYNVNDEAIASTKTDTNGRYEFTNIPAGHYWLKVNAKGYVSLGNGDREGMGKNVTVANGEVVNDVDLNLLLGGTISGRILDSSGNPVVDENVHIAFIDEPVSRSLPTYFPPGPFKTQADGAFNIDGIPPGRYLVSIGVDLPRLRGDVVNKNDYFAPLGRVIGDHYFEQTFYPGVTDRRQAHSVVVSAGEATTGINMTVGQSLPAYTVSGRVVDAQTGKGLANARLELIRRYSNGGYSGATAGGIQINQTDEDGNFRLSGLIPGKFFVGAFLIESTSDIYSSQVDFEIKDADINGLTIKALHGLTLEGKVVIDDDAKGAAASLLPGLEISTWIFPPETNSIDMFRSGSVGKDGRFKVSGLRRGDVKISLAPKRESHYFSVARLELPKAEDKTQTQILQADPAGEAHLEMTDQNLKDVRVVLIYKNASIKGHVTVIGGRLPDNMRLTVGVYHPINNEGASSTWSSDCDVNGDFILDGLEPGDYRIEISDGSRNFTETKTIIVKKGAAIEVSFTVNSADIKDR